MRTLDSMETRLSKMIGQQVNMAHPAPIATQPFLYGFIEGLRMARGIFPLDSDADDLNLLLGGIILEELPEELPIAHRVKIADRARRRILYEVVGLGGLLGV